MVCELCLNKKRRSKKELGMNIKFMYKRSTQYCFTGEQLDKLKQTPMR